MRGKITLENGVESIFFLTDEDVETLELKAAEVRERSGNDILQDYNIANEMAYGAHKWAEQLRERQAKKAETPAGGAAGESKVTKNNITPSL